VPVRSPLRRVLVGLAWTGVGLAVLFAGPVFVALVYAVIL
jgi:hypothetical protein